MKTGFVALMVVHGLIHLLGFVKAFQLGDVSQLTQSISKTSGIFWLISAILFFAASILFLLQIQGWWIVAGFAVACSQILVVQGWTDAKFGTIANVIIAVPVIISFISVLPSSYQNQYRTEVQKRLPPAADAPLVSEKDIAHLPTPVQKYLRYVGVVDKPKVQNFRAVFRGNMKRTMEGTWMDISAEQYNFYDDPARLFYIESSMFGIPFDGFHRYVGESATMQIKVASLVQVVDAKGEKMNQGETVTMFNDMCLLAPATLIDKTIQWQPIDSLTVKAIFTNKGNTITATLFFNEHGALANFISNDRYLSDDGKTYTRYPWSTPVKEYRDFDGRKVPLSAEAIWHTPQGEYAYAKFLLQDIEYNCSTFRELMLR